MVERHWLQSQNVSRPRQKSVQGSWPAALCLKGPICGIFSFRGILIIYMLPNRVIVHCPPPPVTPKCIFTSIGSQVWGISTIHFYAGEVASGRTLPKSQQEEDDPLQMGGDFTLNRWIVIVMISALEKFCAFRISTSPVELKFIQHGSLSLSHDIFLPCSAFF